ncbi:MAG: hypothetical protein JSS73_14880 [Bacteroidetes bacterium]|nr:hypothetical protein [Bacteroidota bacterium]
MKFPITLVLLMLTQEATSQKIFFKPDDYTNNGGVVVTHLNIGPKYFSMELSSNLRVGESKKINKDSVWGYCNSDGTVYRIVNRYSFRVIEKESPLSIYSIHHLYFNTKYFSAGLDRPLLKLTIKNLIRTAKNKEAIKLVLAKMKKDKIRIAKMLDNQHAYLNKYINDLGVNPF